MRTFSVFFRLLAFFFAFALEVRVKAAEIVQLPNAEEVIQEPKECLDDVSVVCALGTGSGEKLKFEIGGSSGYLVQMDQSTSIIRLSASEIQLVAGTIWVKAKGELVVRSEFGSIRMDGAEAWASRTQDRVTAASIHGAVRLAPRGSSEVLDVLPGTENWLGRVGARGVAETGIPKAIALESHLPRWARLYSGTRKQFEKEALKFREVWVEASKTTAELNKELHDRKVASLLAEKAQREEAQRKKLARDREIRAMFRQKVLSGE